MKVFPVPKGVPRFCIEANWWRNATHVRVYTLLGLVWDRIIG